MAFYLSSERLEKAVLSDKRNGKLSSETKKMFWSIAENLSKKGNFNGYDVDTVSDMRVAAFSSMCKYWRNYVPYLFSIGESKKSSIKDFETERKRALIEKRYGEIRIYRNSAFAYFTQIAYQTFVTVLSKKKKNPLDGFGYRTGEVGKSFGGHVVVSEELKEERHRIRESFDAGDSFAAREYEDNECTPKYGWRKTKIGFVCSSYEIVYDRSEAVDAYLRVADDVDQLLDCVERYGDEDPEIRKEIGKDPSFFHLLYETAKRRERR